jgi:UV excision repair protein RAD23
MVVQGIPEERERPQAPPQTQTQTQTQTSPPPPPASPTTQRIVPIPGGVTADEAVNLFEAAAQAGSGQASAGRGARGGAQAGAEPGQLGNLDFLRNNPHFQQLRMLVQQQPQMLEPILQQVGAGNPQLAQLIGQNQEQFLQLLSEDFDDDAQLPPGTQAISVTEEERDAIERVRLNIIFPPCF